MAFKTQQAGTHVYNCVWVIVGPVSIVCGEVGGTGGSSYTHWTVLKQSLVTRELATP